MRSGLVRVGGFLSILAACFIVTSVVFELMTGVPLQTMNQFVDLSGFIFYSFDWGGVAIQKLISYSFLIVGLILLVPVFVSMSEFLSPGKSIRRLLISLVSLIPIFLLVNTIYPVFDFTLYAALPVSERTPEAAIPGIVHSHSGQLALIMIGTAVFAPLVFTLTFGVQAMRARKAELSRPVRGLGFVSALMGLCWLPFLMPDIFSVLGYYLSEVSLLVFSLWVLLLGISMLKVELSPSPGFWKATTFGAIISGVVLASTAFIGLTIELSNVVEGVTSPFFGQWRLAADTGLIFVILGSIGVIMAFTASQGFIKIVSQRENPLRHVSLAGLLGGLTILLSVFVLIYVTIWLGFVAERAVFEWTVNEWFRLNTYTYANYIRLFAVSGFLVVSLVGVLLASINALKSDIPRGAVGASLAFGLVGAGASCVLLIEPLVIFPSLGTFFSLLVLSIWLVVMGVISHRYRPRVVSEEYSNDTPLDASDAYADQSET